MRTVHLNISMYVVLYSYTILSVLIQISCCNLHRMYAGNNFFVNVTFFSLPVVSPVAPDLAGVFSCVGGPGRRKVYNLHICSNEYCFIPYLASAILSVAPLFLPSPPPPWEILCEASGEMRRPSWYQDTLRMYAVYIVFFLKKITEVSGSVCL